MAIYISRKNTIHHYVLHIFVRLVKSILDLDFHTIKGNYHTVKGDFHTINSFEVLWCHKCNVFCRDVR